MQPEYETPRKIKNRRAAYAKYGKNKSEAVPSPNKSSYLKRRSSIIESNKEDNTFVGYAQVREEKSSKFINSDNKSELISNKSIPRSKRSSSNVLWSITKDGPQVSVRGNQLFSGPNFMEVTRKRSRTLLNWNQSKKKIDDLSNVSSHYDSVESSINSNRRSTFAK